MTGRRCAGMFTIKSEDAPVTQTSGAPSLGSGALSSGSAQQPSDATMGVAGQSAAAAATSDDESDSSMSSTAPCEEVNENMLAGTKVQGHQDICLVGDSSRHTVENCWSKRNKVRHCIAPLVEQYLGNAFMSSRVWAADVCVGLIWAPFCRGLTKLWRR